MRTNASETRTPLQRLVQERTNRDIEELLRDLYVEKRHSDQEIATALGEGVSRANVQLWREKFGISREDRKPPLVAA